MLQYCTPRALSLRNLVSGYECWRVFPAGVEPGSPLRDAFNWLPSRFGLSVETRRRYGWLRMVFPGVRVFQQLGGAGVRRSPTWSASLPKIQLISRDGWSNKSPGGAVLVPFPPKTGTNLLHPHPLQSLNDLCAPSDPHVGALREGGGTREAGNTVAESLVVLYQVGTHQIRRRQRAARPSTSQGGAEPL